MNKDEIVKYWVDSSDCDFKTMNHLFESKDYVWSLFVGHLVIEKLAKAYYVKIIDNSIPFSHNLLYILSKTDIVMNDEKKDLLSDLNTFNIAARYDDYKQVFKKKCNKEYTGKYIKEIKILRIWLKKLIKQ